MSKMAIIGDSTSVLGFKPIGVDTFDIAAPEDVIKIWDDVLAGGYGIVMMTEPVFEVALPLVKQLETKTTPAVLAIPSTAGPTGAGRRYIKDLMERAVGAAIKE